MRITEYWNFETAQARRSWRCILLASLLLHGFFLLRNAQTEVESPELEFETLRMEVGFVDPEPTPVPEEPEPIEPVVEPPPSAEPVSTPEILTAQSTPAERDIPVQKKLTAPTAKPRIPQVRPKAAAAMIADTPPSISRNSPPEYPASARKAGMEGQCRIRLEIDAKGAVKAARMMASTGHTVLDESALRAVKRWRFRPAQKGGITVASTIDVPVSFSLKAK